MRLAALLLGIFVFVGGAQAQNFGSSTLSPVNGGFNSPSPTGTPLLTDLVLLNRLTSPGTFSTTGLQLGSFASAADFNSANARIDQAFQQLARIDQAFQQIARLNQTVDHGITAAVALPSASMPSARGRTSWAVNAATFSGDVGAGASIAHRFDTSVPLAVTASYGYGGGSANVARLGLMGEF
jgi:hypothetical protein